MVVKPKKSNPYRIEPPFSISFSGGRSSGYMLYHILDAYDGKLPDDGHVLFANTGKECEESLQFVAKCAEMWNVKIHWLEYRRDAPKHLVEVDFASAARNGEPFEDLVMSGKSYQLPNAVKRLCTFELKVQLFINFMKMRGYEYWDDAIGFRADEPSRVAKVRQNISKHEKDGRTVMIPMYQAGVTKVRHILQFWTVQSFDLLLPDNGDGRTLAGNCDLCFLKSVGILKRLIREQPNRSDWWIRVEETVRQRRLEQEKSLRGVTFRYGQTYASLKRAALAAKEIQFFPDGDDAGISCFCGD